MCYSPSEQNNHEAGMGDVQNRKGETLPADGHTGFVVDLKPVRELLGGEVGVPTGEDLSGRGRRPPVPHGEAAGGTG